MQSKSKYLHLNGTNVKQVNENGSPKNGEFFAEDKKTILRFKNGFLDGDIDTINGLIVKPAVEGPGHQEYWRENKLHRDNEMPAVISDGFAQREYWIDGIKQEVI